LPEVFQKMLYFNNKQHILSALGDQIYMAEIMLHLNISEPIGTPDAIIQISMTVYL
jgi:hypothetical protein